MFKKHSFQYFSKNMDTLFALMGVAVGSVILLLYYLVDLNQQDIGFVIISSCLVYLLFRNSLRSTNGVKVAFSFRYHMLLNIIFFTFYSITLVMHHNQLYTKPLSYFILTSILIGIIAIEIIASNGKNQVQLLLKTLLLSMTFRFETFYNFPSISGADAYWHAKIIQFISDTAFVPSIEVSSKYFYYPIFHIFISLMSTLSNINIKNSLFFSIGLSSLFCSIFIYLIAIQIFDTKSGLIALLLYNFSDSILDYGLLNLTPGSLVLCYFLVILYVYYKKQVCVENRLILLFMTFISIITHQLSTFIVLVVLLLAHFARTFHIYANSSKDLIASSKTYILTFAVFLQFYWMSTYVRSNRTFFDFVVGPMIHALITDIAVGSEEVVTYAVYYSTLSNILFHLGYLILLFIGIGGIISGVISKDNREYSMSIVSVALFSFIYGVPLLGIRNMLTGRWVSFVTIFLVILGSSYLSKIIYLTKSNSKIIFSFFLITSLITFFMITTPYINNANPLYSEERFSRTAFKESEINALKIINTYNGTVKTDRSYTNGLFRQMDTNSKIEAIDLEYISSDTINDEGKLVLLRKCSLVEPVGITDPKSLGAGQVKMKLPVSFFERYDSFKYNFIYNNGNVNGYLKD